MVHTPYFRLHITQRSLAFLAFLANHRPLLTSRLCGVSEQTCGSAAYSQANRFTAPSPFASTTASQHTRPLHLQQARPPFPASPLPYPARLSRLTTLLPRASATGCALSRIIVSLTARPRPIQNAAEQMAALLPNEVRGGGGDAASDNAHYHVIVPASSVSGASTTTRTYIRVCTE